MRELVNEVLLRLSKAAASLVLGAILFAVIVGLGRVAPTPELALLCWLSGVALILVVQESPI